MNTTLDQMLNSIDPPELVDPIELTQVDVSGKELIAVCLLGILNPMGPTLVAINLVSKEGKPSEAILCTSLNPFAQTRRLIARAPSNPLEVFMILESCYQVGTEQILGGWPTLVLPMNQQPECQAALHQMLFGLLNAVKTSEPVSKVLADLREHHGDPWGRIPSFEKMILRAHDGRNAGGEDAPMTEDEFAEWISLMGAKEHMTSEFSAIVASPPHATCPKHCTIPGQGLGL